MKKNHLGSGAILAILAFVVVTMSSCNRGIGCPSEFSVDIDVVQSLAHAAIQAIF